MDDNQNFIDELEKKKISGTLNALTILTFIGSGIGILSGLYSFATAEANYERTKEAINNGSIEKLPAFLKNLMSPEMVEMQRKLVEYKLPIMLVTIFASVLCLVGAIQMRKLKAEGFWIWLIGEILPFFATVMFIGLVAFSNAFSWFGIVITLVFVALYASQKKYLS